MSSFKNKSPLQKTIVIKIRCIIILVNTDNSFYNYSIFYQNTLNFRIESSRNEFEIIEDFTSLIELQLDRGRVSILFLHSDWVQMVSFFFKFSILFKIIFLSSLNFLWSSTNLIVSQYLKIIKFPQFFYCIGLCSWNNKTIFILIFMKIILLFWKTTNFN